MTAILPPDGSLTFIGALLIPLVLGFLIGVVARAAIKIGLVLVVIVVILIALGFVDPNQLIQPLVQYVRSGPALVDKVNQIAGYLPYSSLGFLVGFIIGFFKG
jgi:hypothetical protein